MRALVVVALGCMVANADTVSAQWPLGKEMQETKLQDFGKALSVTGRFQVFTTPQAKDSTFMLDTETGRVWIMRKDHASGNFSIHRLFVEEVDTKENKPTAPKPESK